MFEGEEDALLKQSQQKAPYAGDKDDSGVNEFGHGMLHKAVIHNRLESFVDLLRTGQDINQQDELGFSPLHLAALLGRHEILQLMFNAAQTKETQLLTHHGPLVENRRLKASFVDINGRTKRGQTALHLAVKNGHCDVIASLTSSGCNPNIADGSGKTALQVAEKLGRKACLDTLKRIKDSYEKRPTLHNNTGSLIMENQCKMESGDGDCNSVEIPVLQSDARQNASHISNQSSVTSNSCNDECLKPVLAEPEGEGTSAESSGAESAFRGKSECSGSIDVLRFASFVGDLNGEGILNQTERSSQLPKAEKELDVQEKCVKNRTLDQVFCLNCRLKRKYTSQSKYDASDIDLDMGASQSMKTERQGSDLWEVWELNNNRNDDKKEWNSPNRSRKNFEQNFVPGASRSNPDLLINEFCSLSEFVELQHGGSDAKERIERSLSCPDFFMWMDEADLRSAESVGGLMEGRLADSQAGESLTGFSSNEFNTIDNRLYSSDFFDPDIKNSLPSVILTSLDDSPRGSSRNLISYSMSPIHSKPDLPYIFCEDIYHIRSDSDLRGKLRGMHRRRSLADDLMSKSTSYLSQCILEEQIDYFPCKDDSCVSIPKHKCYDWSLSLESPQECDKDHLTVSIRSRDDDVGLEPSYSYICAENEDLEGSFVCSDCGEIIPRLELHGDDENAQPRNFKETDNKDEFVLICLPDSEKGSFNGDINDTKRKFDTNFLTTAMCIYPRDDNTRIRRLSGAHSSLENIEEIEVEAERSGECEDESSDLDFPKPSCEEGTTRSGLAAVPVKPKDRSDCGTDEKADQSFCAIEFECNSSPESKNVDCSGSNECHFMEYSERTKETCTEKYDAHVHCEQLSKYSTLDNLVALAESRSDDSKGLKEEDIDARSICDNNGCCHNSAENANDLPSITTSDLVNIEGDRDNCNYDDSVHGKEETVFENCPLLKSADQSIGGKANNAYISIESDNETEVLKSEEFCNSENHVKGNDANGEGYKSVKNVSNAKNMPEMEEKGCEKSLKETRDSDLFLAEAVQKDDENEAHDHTTPKSKGQLGIIGTNLRFPIELRMTGNVDSLHGVASNSFDKTNDNKSNDDTYQEANNGYCEDAIALAQGDALIPALPVFDSEEGLMLATIVKQANFSGASISACGENDLSVGAVKDLTGSSYLNHTTLQADGNGCERGTKNVNEKDVPSHMTEAQTLAKDNSTAGKYYSNDCNHQKSCLARESPPNECHQCRVYHCNGDAAYGCLQCTYDRGMSRSTNESLISTDTGIDVDDMSLTDWDDFGVGLEGTQPSNCKEGRSDVTSTPVYRRRSSHQLHSQPDVVVACARKMSFKIEDSALVENGTHRRMEWPVNSKPIHPSNALGTQTIANPANSKNTVKHEHSPNSGLTSNDSRNNFPSIANKISHFENNIMADEVQKETGQLRENSTEECHNKSDSCDELLLSEFFAENRNDEAGRSISSRFVSEGETYSPIEASRAGSEASFANNIELVNEIRDYFIQHSKIINSTKNNDAGSQTNVVCEDFDSDEIIGLKLFAFNLETQNGLSYQSPTGPKNQNAIHLNSCIVIFKKKHSLKGVRLICCNFKKELTRIGLPECWLIKDAKALALVFIKVAESSLHVRLQALLAEKLISQAAVSEGCNFDLLINWILVFLGLIKSETRVYVSKDLSKVLFLLQQIVRHPDFELPYTRRIAFTVARARSLPAGSTGSRMNFIMTCINIEVSNISFSCKYPFKIFVAVHQFLCNLDDDFQAARETLDKHLADFLCHDNSLDFVSDVLIYLGLLKSEFQVNTTTDLRSCLPLLTHVVGQPYFPKSGASFLHAFIMKPNPLLKDLVAETSNLLSALEIKVTAFANQ